MTTSNDYLQSLTLKLADGVGRLPDERRGRLAEFFRGAQQADGGFAGREGGSDLYYTGFGLRAMALTGSLTEETVDLAARFLAERLSGRESIVDFYSLLYGAQILKLFGDRDLFAELDPGWRDTVLVLLNRLRREDGGFAKGPEGRASSTYHTFLVMLCFELIERPLPRPEQAASFFRSQFHEEGGYREIRVSKRAGTNPTAAAVAGLRMLGALDQPQAEATAEFLLDMQTDEGGFRANTRIPIADLLSTFTAMVTLADLQAFSHIDLRSAARYVDSMQQPSGGFIGAAWDEVADVEYSFYGLGSLGLITHISALSD